MLFWYMCNDVAAYSKQCKSSTTAQKVTLSVTIFPNVIKTAAVDLCPLAKVDGFYHLIFCTMVCTSYLLMEAKPIKSKDARIKNGKWTEAKPIKSKDARMENGNPFGLFCKRRCISSKPSNKNDNLT